MLAAFEHAAGETAQKKTERFLFGGTIIEGDSHHDQIVADARASFIPARAGFLPAGRRYGSPAAPAAAVAAGFAASPPSPTCVLTNKPTDLHSNPRFTRSRA
jgi:hypothetical protein